MNNSANFRQKSLKQRIKRKAFETLKGKLPLNSVTLSIEIEQIILSIISFSVLTIFSVFLFFLLIQILRVF